MQFLTNKAKATAIFVTILMVTSIAAMASPVQAQSETHGGPPGGGYEGPATIPPGVTPDFTIAPAAFISVRPNPVGVGQEMLVNMWVTPASGGGKYCNGFTVTITHPDGKTEDVNLKSYVADGTSWFTYVPDAVGQWKFVFKFAGEYFPQGYWASGQYSLSRTGVFAGALFFPSEYMLPATSDVSIITVQGDFVISWQSPIPTGYWTRPIEPNNREWNIIAGNYPWGEQIGGAESWTDEYYGPFVTAPNTPHILWEQTTTIAGIIGGETGNYATLSGAGTPSVIYQGRCYQTVTKVMTVQNLSSTPSTLRQQPTSVAECFDLRTGKIYYDIPTADGGITPTHIAYWAPSVVAAGGTVPGEIADLSYTVDLFTISGTRLYKINPTTGAVSANITIPAFTTAEMFYRDGYMLSYQRINYTTQSPAVNVTVNRASTGFLVNWTTLGSSTNFTGVAGALAGTAGQSRVVSNITVTIPESLRTPYETGAYGALGAYDPDTGITVVQDRGIYGGYYGSNYWAVNLVTGQTIWNISSPLSSSASVAYRPTNAWCRHGRYIVEMQEGTVQARRETDGQILWTTPIPDLPWGEFWMYDEAALGDLVYGVGYTGVFAFNETNGAIAWHYVDVAVPFETPYMSANETIPSYSVQNIRVADGKVYVEDSEHSPTLPATRGWGLNCLNATTGEKLWKISGTNMAPGPAADGYMVTSSSYDGTMFVLGKGQSQTTVTAPVITVAKDTSVLIQGTVMDMSPAQPGSACVSDKTMDTWMDYLHFQMPADGFYHNVTVTGVPVLLLATDANGSSNTIGTAMSDVTGNYQIAWTPQNTGLYKIVAVFAGTDSYGSSTAETGLSVGPAPEPVVIPPAAQPADYTWTIVGMGIAIIIVVAIATVLILMKRK